MNRHMRPPLLALGSAIAIAFVATGCAGKDKPPDPRLMGLATTEATQRDPALFAGTWEGDYHTGDETARLTFNITDVQGNQFKGSYKTLTGSGTVRGTITNATYSGTAERRTEQGLIAVWAISGMWSPQSMTVNFHGRDLVGARAGHAFLGKVR